MSGASARNRSMSYFGAGERQTIVTRRISGGVVGVSRLTYDGEESAPVAPPDAEEALLLHLHLRPQVAEISIDGRAPAPLYTPAGQVNLLDFRQRFGGRIFAPFDMVGFHLPFAAFDDLAPEYGGRRLDGVRLKPTEATVDPRAHGLALALLPGFARPEQLNHLFLDHVGWALVAHVGVAYGVFAPPADGAAGGLSAWRLRRATEMIAADLSGRVRLAELAAACGLPVARFSRAFRESLGMTPPEWLLQRRLDRAMRLLASSDLPLSRIASESGFSDQSHMTRSFRRHLGQPPGAWRRSL